MITFSIAAALAAVAFAYVAWGFFKANGSLKKQIEELEKEGRNLRAAIKERDRAMTEMQEAYHEAERKKKTLRSGDPDADFKRSLDLLRDVPGESDTD